MSGIRALVRELPAGACAIGAVAARQLADHLPPAMDIVDSAAPALA